MCFTNCVITNVHEVPRHYCNEPREATNEPTEATDLQNILCGQVPGDGAITR